MDFVTSHFGKMNLCSVEHFFNIFVLTFGWVCWVQMNPPKSEDKYVEKVFNRLEVQLSEMTCYKFILQRTSEGSECYQIGPK